MAKIDLETRIFDVVKRYHYVADIDPLLVADLAALFKEHYKRSRRVKEAMVKAREEGKILGRPEEYDEKDESIVTALLDQGKSIREIEEETGINRGKVHRIRQKHFALDLV